MKRSPTLPPSSDPDRHSPQNPSSQIQLQSLQLGVDAILGINVQGQVVFMNKTAERLFGYTTEELVGQPAQVLVPVKYRRKDSGHSLGTATDPWGIFSDPRVPFTAGRRGGIEFPAEIISDVVETSEGPINFVIFRALTAKEGLGTQMEQAKKMEALGRLVSGIAHDFNNLLMVILANSELTLTDPHLKGSPRKALEELHSAAVEATSIAGQLLLFGRKEMKDPKTIRLDELIRDMTPMLRGIVGETIVMTINQNGGPSAVKAEPSHMKQLLMNLVANARDAMPKGGRLTIEIANVDIDSSSALSISTPAAGKYVVLKVADSGFGMDEGTIPHLFEPFFTTKDRGTGLGLATVYGIVKQSKGEIFVSSSRMRGTTFTIFFPRIEESVEVASVAVEPTAAPVRKDATILVVEDKQALRGVVCKFLKTCGYKILEARDSTAALRKIRAYPLPIDLLITDVVMPNANGPTLAAQFRHRDPGAKILFMTGYDEVDLRETGVQRDIPILKKPFSMSELQRIINVLLHKPLRALQTT